MSNGSGGDAYVRNCETFDNLADAVRGNERAERLARRHRVRRFFGHTLFAGSLVCVGSALLTRYGGYEWAVGGCLVGAFGGSITLGMATRDQRDAINVYNAGLTSGEAACDDDSSKPSE